MIRERRSSSTQARAALIDSSAFFALSDESDRRHAEATAVLESLGISHAFSFDDDFRQYGLAVL